MSVSVFMIFMAALVAFAVFCMSAFMAFFLHDNLHGFVFCLTACEALCDMIIDCMLHQISFRGC